MNRDPDLFDIMPGDIEEARVFVFPIERRSALIRKTADALFVINPARADRYWQGVLKALRKELVAAGVPAADMHGLLVPFYRAVEARLHEKAAMPKGWPMGGSAA